MPLINVLKAKYSSSFLIETEETSFLFDIPADIYGCNHSFLDLNNKTKKDIKFILPNVDFENIDSIFISNSRSLGVFFIDKTFKGNIYITDPVYEQLLLRLEELQSYCITYQESDSDLENMEPTGNLDFKENMETTQENNFDKSRILLEIKKSEKKVKKFKNKKFKLVSIREANVSFFKKRVVKIKFNQRIFLDGICIESLSSNTYIGWTNYSMKYLRGCEEKTANSIIYVSSISYNKRFSFDSPKFTGDVIFLNQNDFKTENLFFKPKNTKTEKEIFLGIEIFTQHILNFLDTKKIVILPSEMTTLFLEIIFHIFSILQKKGKNVPVYVISPIFEKFNTVVNIQSEWLNDIFQKTSYLGNEPFPFKHFKPFNVINNFSNLRNLEEPSLVFCSSNELKFLKNNFTIENYIICNVNNAINSEYWIDKDFTENLIATDFCKKTGNPEELDSKLEVNKTIPQSYVIPGLNIDLKDCVVQKKKEIKKRENSVVDNSKRIKKVKKDKIKNYEIKLEATLEEIREKNKESKIFCTTVYKNMIYLDTRNSYFVEDFCNFYDLEIEGTTDIYFKDGFAFIDGILTNNDFETQENIKIKIRNTKNFLKQLFLTEKYFVINDWYIFPEKKFKIKLNFDKIFLEKL
ncbi:putative beta-lactamase-like protein [Hamiltosporidium magnivora]|uniref:Putative beta-lactamase-like protein n=1 Tax=Hamiltosporidium magnivora TaxID=148818 RepID=A0A4Q9KWX2_9MICR|nr:putative beta-lactamase-like protein [Hamiltosporidium magnivora]